MPRYFFITGTPRSGTTLLQAMLMRGKGVYVPPETKFLEVTWHDRLYLGDLRTEKGWRRAVAAVLRVVEIAEIPLDAARLRSELAGPPRDYRYLFQALLDAVALHVGADWIGEKSPVHTQYANKLLELFPEARVVQVLRDPRDVALSQQEAWGTTALQASLRWRRDSAKHLEYRRSLGTEQYRAVHYEKLVQRPESTLRSVCGFLGLPFEEAMLEPHLRSRTGFASSETHKLRTLEPVTAARIGRHETVLGKSDRAVVEWICGPEMRALGYEIGRLPRWRGLSRASVQVPNLVRLHLKRHVALMRRRMFPGQAD